MQRCSVCRFRSLHDERLVDEDGIDRGSRTACSRCGHVEREALIVEPSRPRGLVQLTGRRPVEPCEEPEPLPPTAVLPVVVPEPQAWDLDAPTERIPVVLPAPATAETWPSVEPDEVDVARPAAVDVARPAAVQATRQLPAGWYEAGPAEG